MPDTPQDILSQTLLRLEEELTAFGSIKNALEEAKNKLSSAQDQWGILSKEQQQSSLELVEATKKALEIVKNVVGQSEKVSESLITMSKAIESVNFPLRLDKIDMAVSTNSSNLASFQAASDRQFNDIHTGLEKNSTTFSDCFGTVETELTASKKRQTAIITILAINLLALLGGAAFLHFEVLAH